MSDIGAAVASSPFCAGIGLSVEEVGPEFARFSLPFAEGNSNPGKVLHGGIAASLADIGGTTVARAALGDASGPFHTAAVQISYLAAAVGETVFAESRLLRRGKELAYVDTAVSTADGKAIARGVSTVRGRFGAEPAETIATRGDAGPADPGAMGPHLAARVPFIGRLGLRVENMSGDSSRIVMPEAAWLADESGEIHEGPVLALLDTAGAMAAWARTGPGAYKASTVGVQAAIRPTARRGDLVAFARLVQRDREIFWCDVEVARAADGAVVASGVVLYRIVV